MVLWNESGLRGTFFAVNCRSVQIGSYKFCPFGRVLISSEGLMLEAQIFDPQEQSSSIWTNVAIPFKEFSKVEACFDRKLTVIFIYASQKVARDVSIQLSLPNSPYCWDPLSRKENERRLILIPFGLDNSAKNAIKVAFNSVLGELNFAEANDLLVMSSPPGRTSDCVPEKTLDMQQGTSVASCSAKEPPKVEVSNFSENIVDL